MNIVEELSKIALLGSTWVMWLLIGLSVVSLTVMAERWLYFRKISRGRPGLRARLANGLLARDDEGVTRLLAGTNIESKVLSAAWRWRSSGGESFNSALESELASHREALERGSTLLGTIGNNAPFIGLFGTVIGVIEAFHYLGDSTGNNANMGKVMAGIAEALVATGVGIFVAIPAVVAFNVIQKKIGQVETEIVALGKLIEAHLVGTPGAQLPEPRGAEGADLRSSGRAAAEKARSTSLSSTPATALSAKE
jgi:biopolymer transport protein ExbB/biopolymer transport protein TolQ